MKIVHLTEAWNGGISTYVNMLLKHQARQHQVTLIYSQSQTNVDFDPVALAKLNIQLVPYNSSRNPLKIFQVSRHVASLLRQIQPDIIHLHSTFPGVYGRWFETFPIVYCAHGWSFVQEAGGLKKFIYAQVEKFLSRRTNAIINISRHEHEAAQAQGVKARHNDIVISGVRDIQTVKEEQQPALHLNPDTLNVVFVGRLDHKKGFDIIENFFSQTVNSSLKLYVIGQSRRESKAVELQDTSNITYLGWVDNEDIDSYLKHFDVVIIPSRQEGFGLVAVEAMRNAKPVIVSNCGGLPELVEEGVNGHIFNMANAQISLAAIFAKLNKKRLAEMGSNGRAMYEKNFTVEKFATAVEDVYRKVL